MYKNSVQQYVIVYLQHVLNKHCNYYNIIICIRTQFVKRNDSNFKGKQGRNLIRNYLKII